MRILFDHSSPAPLRRHLQGHDVKEAFDLGWHRLSSGELLAEAETDGVSGTKKEAAARLREIVATVGRPGKPGANVRCVVSAMSDRISLPSCGSLVDAQTNT